MAIGRTRWAIASFPSPFTPKPWPRLAHEERTESRWGFRKNNTDFHRLGKKLSIFLIECTAFDGAHPPFLGTASNLVHRIPHQAFDALNLAFGLSAVAPEA